MAVAIQTEDMKFLCETMKLIGDYYLVANDIKNAIFAYNHLKILSEMLSFEKIKVDCLINLSHCCKKLKNYDHSLVLLKKALQFSWHYHLDSKELKIYDEMGLINFLQGNISKAHYYHERYYKIKLH